MYFPFPNLETILSLTTSSMKSSIGVRPLSLDNCAVSFLELSCREFPLEPVAPPRFGKPISAGSTPKLEDIMLIR